MEAYWNRVPVDAGWFQGTTKNGMIIQMGIKYTGFDEMPKIEAAYPMY